MSDPPCRVVGMFETAPDCTGWNGLSRVVQATWDALVEQDPTDVKLGAIAQRANVSAPLMNHYFRRRGDLFELVAVAAIQALQTHIAQARTPETLAARWLEFAGAMPRHYHLAFDPAYARTERVAFQRTGLRNFVRAALRTELAGAEEPHVHAVIAILHGATALPADEVNAIRWTVAQLKAYLNPDRCPDSAAWSSSSLPPC